MEKIAIDNRSYYFVEINKKSLNIGTYLVPMKIRKCKINIGSLGETLFQKGYYVYVGSGLNNLEKRVKRHLAKNKKNHWHIDYLTTNENVTIMEYLFLFYELKIEDELARKLLEISDGFIKSFGSSDSRVISHLFFFKRNPLDLLKSLVSEFE